ncbi:MAG: 2-amino-4-hydroxy-6-hydroxymethyldihydropteridine diphosphokinase [Pseudomonadota bacterium]
MGAAPRRSRSPESENGHRWHPVFVAVGSNLGDKLANCREAVRRLTGQPDVRAVAASRFYRTAPVDYTDQDWFVNSAILIETRFSPHDLLDCLKAIEVALGRQAGGVRFGPRSIDLDIIFYERRTLVTERLEVPHPRMHKRRFVLQPICDIDPAFIHPVFNQTVRYLLDNIDDPEQGIIPLL